jgi:hypothetical protein
MVELPPFCPPRIWNQGKARDLACSPKGAFCPPRIWNQGKAANLIGAILIGFCPPRIWNQGKARPSRTRGPSRFCPPRIWNQGKATCKEETQSALAFRVHGCNNAGQILKHKSLTTMKTRLAGLCLLTLAGSLRAATTNTITVTANPKTGGEVLRSGAFTMK